MAGMRAEMRVEPPAELEFWRSESWVDIWAGVPLLVPQPGSAASLVREALLPGSNVNFPQITEICERIATEPPEIAEATNLLVAALRDSYAPFQKKLKALTISNELMYEERAVSSFRAVEGLREVLTTLRSARDTGLGVPIDENIRMLATEIDKICFSGAAVPQARPGQLTKFGSALKTNLEAKLGSALKTNTEVRAPISATVPVLGNGVLPSSVLPPQGNAPPPMPTRGNVVLPPPPQEATTPPLKVVPPPPPQETTAPPLPILGKVVQPLPPQETAAPPLPTLGNVVLPPPPQETAAPPLPTLGNAVPPLPPQQTNWVSDVAPSHMEANDDGVQFNSIAEGEPRSELEPQANTGTTVGIPSISPNTIQPHVGQPSNVSFELTKATGEVVGTTSFSTAGMTPDRPVDSLPTPCEQPPTPVSPTNAVVVNEDDPTITTVAATPGFEAPACSAELPTPSLDLPLPLAGSSAPCVGESLHSNSFPATTGLVGTVPPLTSSAPGLYVAAPVAEFPTPPTSQASNILAGEPNPVSSNSEPIQLGAAVQSLELPAFLLNLPPPPTFAFAAPSSGVATASALPSQLSDMPATSLDLPTPPNFKFPAPPLGTAITTAPFVPSETSGLDPPGPISQLPASTDSAVLFGDSAVVDTLVPAPTPPFGVPPSSVNPLGAQASADIAVAFGLPDVQTPFSVQPPETQPSPDIAAAFGLHAVQELPSVQPAETQAATNIAAAFDLPAVSTDVASAFGLPLVQASSNVKPPETQTATDVAVAFGLATVPVPELDAVAPSPCNFPPQTGASIGSLTGTGLVVPTPPPQAPPTTVVAAGRGVDSLFD